MIKRIHIVGLPRSGTTALSKMVAERLGLPLASEPIFLWNDGFKIDLFNNDLQQEHRLSRVQEGLARLDRMFSRHGGYVEKTPSSALLAPYFYKIQRYAYIVHITRNRSAVIKSLERMVFEKVDGNAEFGETFTSRKLKVRGGKFVFMIKALGPLSAILALFRYLSGERRSSIASMSTRLSIEQFVDKCLEQLNNINYGPENRLIEIPYERFRQDPEGTISAVLAFCCEPFESRGD